MHPKCLRATIVVAFFISAIGMIGATEPRIPQQSEHDHAAHMDKPAYGARQVVDKLTPLKKLPASGVAREAGYDGRYAMEATSNEDLLLEQCAKASRGLVMLDNSTWQKCGGKPDGWSKGPENSKSESVDHSGHVGH